MRKLLSSTVVATICAIAAHAPAASLFSDNFDTENGGVGILNDYSLTNWNVTSGSVDLIGNGFFDFLPGNGLYIDLDGSTGQAGTMVSNDISLDAGSYLFQFDLAGSQRGPLEPVIASVTSGSSTLVSQNFNLPSDQGFTLYSLPFVVASPEIVNLSFSETGNSNQGELLDNVNVISAVSSGAPLPSAACGGMVLMAGLLVTRIRKQLQIA